MGLTQDIAGYVAKTRYRDIPSDVVQLARGFILDGLGVALAGSTDECSRIVQAQIRRMGGRAECSVLGTALRAPAAKAALANGVAAHAMDYDDTQLSTSKEAVYGLLTHPTTPVLAAALAIGERERIGGDALLLAYILGVEVECRIADAIHPRHYQSGFHSTATVGGLGAAVAAGKILRLKEEALRRALGIAASMAAGLRENFGTMTKPLHVGLGARNGVLAAKLAAAGYTANGKAIESEFGFYRVFHPGAPIDDQPIDELGRSFALLSDGLRIKPYPCGGLTHQVIDAVLDCRAKHGLSAEAIDSIDVDVVKHTFDRIVFLVPQNGIQGKFCMPYLVARAIIDGKIGLDSFTDSAVKDPNVLKLAARVRMNLDESLKKADRAGRPCRVTIRLKNGQTLAREAQHAKGGPEYPMTEDELKAKFLDCAQQALPRPSAERALDQIEQLERLDDLRPLCDILRG